MVRHVIGTCASLVCVCVCVCTVLVDTFRDLPTLTCLLFFLFRKHNKTQ